MFLKILLITIAVLWLLRFAARLLLPVLFQKIVKKAQQQAGQHQQYQQQQRQRSPEGRIKVDYVPPKDKEAIAADRAGEFVDFEEVKEK
jgi:hypothetical protein